MPSAYGWLSECAMQALIPHNYPIIELAVTLTNKFVADGRLVRGWALHTINDMNHVASIFKVGLPLPANEFQVVALFLENGWAATRDDAPCIPSPASTPTPDHSGDTAA